MRISKIYIEGFGKLTDFETEPSSGFNLVFGMNESGKSTLQAFIKGMIFGLDKKDKARFRPWFSDKYCGNIEYKLDDGTKYHIRRDFENETVTITDLQSNELQEDESFIQRQFGIDQGTFMASAYMEQSKVRFDDKLRDNVTSVLDKLFESEFKQITVEETLELLTQYGRSTDREEIESEIRRIEEKLSQLKKDSEIREKSPGQQMEDISLMVKKLNIIKRNYEEIEKAISEKEAIVTKASTVKEKYNEEDINSLIDLRNKAAILSERKNFLLIPFFILCLGAIGLGVYSFVTETRELYLAALGILGLSFVILIIDGAITLSRNKKLRKTKKAIEGITEKNNMDTDIGSNELMAIKSDIQEKNSGERDPADKLEKLEETIALRFASIKLNADAELKTCEDIPAYMSELVERIEVVSGEAQRKEKESFEERIAALEERLDDLRRKKLEALKTEKIFELAADTMKRSGEGIQNDYLKLLSDEISTTIKKITSGRHDKIDTENMYMRSFMPDTRDPVSSNDLSKGTSEQLYLALRMGILAVLSEKGESLPVLMDEIFAYSDERRIVESVKYLREQKDTFQMFYFTCRRHEASIVKTIIGEELNIIRLKV
jgi:uncharacterized protein YhaN